MFHVKHFSVSRQSLIRRKLMDKYTLEKIYGSGAENQLSRFRELNENYIKTFGEKPQR